MSRLYQCHVSTSASFLLSSGVGQPCSRPSWTRLTLRPPSGIVPWYKRPIALLQQQRCECLNSTVSRDRAINNLMRKEQGGRGFKDFLADKEDQMHLGHSWEALTSEDMKRSSQLGGLKDRTRAAT